MTERPHVVVKDKNGNDVPISAIRTEEDAKGVWLIEIILDTEIEAVRSASVLSPVRPALEDAYGPKLTDGIGKATRN